MTQINLVLQDEFPFGIADTEPNPCVMLYGPGPTTARCKHCQMFLRVTKGKTYFKCALRRISNSEATDHRANWPTCSKFIRASLI
ncbi:MAG: hypothetical protein U1F65_05815 [Verrucomicrobiota bacterium]